MPVSLDYLNFTLFAPVDAVIDFVLAAVDAHGAVQRKNGIHGYDHCIDVESFAKIAHGGESQRGTVLVSINGEGCQRIKHWKAVHDFILRHSGRITRCDVCVDDFTGAVLTVEQAMDAWREGEFVNGGRPPKAELHDDLGSGAGRTFYVGSRAGGKLCRVYEKGKQLGDVKSAWVRGEVELHNKDRVIPLDILLDPVRFLAGSFPYFSALSLIVEKIRTVKAFADVTVATVIHWLRESGGAALNAVFINCGRDAVKTIDTLRREALPRRLQWCREQFA